jgi:hypothetical protein
MSIRNSRVDISRKDPSGSSLVLSLMSDFRPTFIAEGMTMSEVNKCMLDLLESFDEERERYRAQKCGVLKDPDVPF